MKATDCGGVRESLPAYLDGDLAPGTAESVRSHLDACPPCRAEFDLLRLTVAALRTLPELPAPAGILSGVRERLWPQPWYRRLLDGRQWVVGLPAGALASLLVVVGVALFQARQNGLEQAALPEAHLAGKPADAPPLSPAPSRAVPARAPATATPPAPAPASAGRAQSPRAAATAAAGKKAPRAEGDQGAAGGAGLRKQALEERAAATPEAGHGVAQVATGAVLDGKERADKAPAVRAADDGAQDATARSDSSPPASRFVIPEPRTASGTEASGDGYPVERPDAPRGSTRNRLGALEGSPVAVSSLRSASGGGAGPGRDRESLAAIPPPASGARDVAPVRRAKEEFRTVGALPSGERASSPGVVSADTSAVEPAAPAGQPAPSMARRAAGDMLLARVVCLLTTQDGSIEELRRVLSREGAGEIVVRPLDPPALREAVAAHRSRLGGTAEPARGWAVTGRAPTRSLGRLLESLAGQPGVRMLEQSVAPAPRGRVPGESDLRITVFR